MKKITKKQFFQEINNKYMALLGVPFNTWNALVIDNEQKISEWLYKADNLPINNLCKIDYAKAIVKNNRIVRGESVIDVINFDIYKTVDNKYILFKYTENKSFNEFSIKLVIYHCRNEI